MKTNTSKHLEFGWGEQGWAILHPDFLHLALGVGRVVLQGLGWRRPRVAVCPGGCLTHTNFGGWVNVDECLSLCISVCSYFCVFKCRYVCLCVWMDLVWACLCLASLILFLLQCLCVLFF